MLQTHTYFTDVLADDNGNAKFQKNVSKAIALDLKKFIGMRVEVAIRKQKSIRTLSQNKLYWLYVTILAKELGYEREEMHSIIGMKFLKREKVDEGTGEVLEYIISTSKLSKSEFGDFIDALIRWAANLGIVLPDPGEQTKMSL